MYPILAEFGPVTIFSLWLLITIGFVAGSYVFVRIAKRQRMRLAVLFDHGITLFFWTLFVSRLTFILLHPALYFYQFKLSKIWALFEIWDKGLSFWGAVFAWFAGIFFLSRKTQESPWKIFDVMTPAILFGMFFGDIGAYLDGINHGTPTGLPWGVIFVSPNVKYIAPIHPTQLYGAFYALLTGLASFALLKKLRGELAGFPTEVGILLFSLFKFLEEFARGDETAKIFSIRLPQIVAAAFFLFAAFLIYARYTNRFGGDNERVLKDLLKNKFLQKFRTPTPEKPSAEKTDTPQNQLIQHRNQPSLQN